MDKGFLLLVRVGSERPFVGPEAVSFKVMLPSACSFIVDDLTFSCRCSTLHVSAYMAVFRCV
jgi:hypothetical protein